VWPWPDGSQSGSVVCTRVVDVDVEESAAPFEILFLRRSIHRGADEMAPFR